MKPLTNNKIESGSCNAAKNDLKPFIWKTSFRHSKIMSVSLILLITIISMATIVGCNNNSSLEENQTVKWPGYEAFPQGYSYMDTTALQRYYNNSSIDSIRQHGWALFAGIMQPSKQNPTWPVWYTWPTTLPTFANTPGLELSAEKDYITESLITKNLKNVLRSRTPTNTILDNIPLPFYPINSNVLKTYPTVCDSSSNSIKTGKHFLNNGDILIPTESLSIEAFEWIRNGKLYKGKTLDSLQKAGLTNLNSPTKFISTKHMFWPVLAKSKQAFSAIPVWDDTIFTKHANSNAYMGYETWGRLVAVDPTNSIKPNQILMTDVSYLYGVKQPDSTTQLPTITKKAKAHNINEFYYHQITQSDWDKFDEADKAILNAASYWAYNKPIGVGDYIVTIAMHINTKELPTWAMQSVWWNDNPNSSKYSLNRPVLTQTKDTTWKHYLLVDAYGIPVNNANQLPIATNPYIELVIHPVATNCNNCHIRAGWPLSSQQSKNMASYQNPLCKDLLQKLNPATDDCLKKYMRTDFAWIIPDHAKK